MLLSETVSVTCHATILHYTVLCVVTLVSYHYRVLSKDLRPGGGGGVLPYISQRVGFSPCFGLKTAIDFAHFGLESGIV